MPTQSSKVTELAPQRRDGGYCCLDHRHPQCPDQAQVLHFYRQCYIAKTRFVSPEAPMNVRGKDVGCLCMGISNVVAEGEYDGRGKWLQHFVQK